jgi:hypothetical protein
LGGEDEGILVFGVLGRLGKLKNKMMVKMA